MKLTSPKQLIIESWNTFKDTWKVLVQIAILVTAPLFLLAAVVAGLVLSGYTLAAIIVGVALILVFIYFFSWAYAASIYVLSSPSDEKTTVIEAYKKTKNRVWAMVGVSLLGSLIILGGLILLIIPGIIFSVWYGMSRYIVVAENLSPVDALKQSRKYADGFFWSIIIRFLVIAAIGFGVSFIIGLVSGLIGLVVPLVGDVFSLIVNVAWSLFTIVYGYHVFTAVKKAHLEKA